MKDHKNQSHSSRAVNLVEKMTWMQTEPLKEVAFGLGHSHTCPCAWHCPIPAYCSCLVLHVPAYAWWAVLTPGNVHARIPEESQPPSKQVKPLFRHFRRIDSCLQTRVAFRGSDESECGH